MQALVVEHDPLSTPERVGDHLLTRGISLDPFVVVEDMENPAVSAEFPEAGRHDLVVLMGAPWSIYEKRCQGWVQPELEFIRSTVDSGTPILGICFGAQALSAAMGGTVEQSAVAEYGWGPVYSSSTWIPSGPWFQFHHDSFTLPPGAVELARNDAGIQAYRLGRGLGVQFHPEMTADLLASWCEAGGDRELIEAGLDPNQVIEETKLRSEESQPALGRMLDWFLDEIAPS
ncbi:MAG: gamma-glutamyl-gamma-aminobutyrate hydrolase family protein [Acidimicrobiia bacterium]